MAISDTGTRDPRNGNTKISKRPPLGILCFQKILPTASVVKKNLWYRGIVLLLTFWSYTCYHATRKTLSVVKNTLTKNCTDGTITPNISPCAWEPFDGPDAKQLLGLLDSSFLFTYAIFMFISGMVAEHLNLRYYVSIGMIMSGFATYLFGLAKVYDIHWLGYFIIVQIFGGICQTTGWPGVVSIMSHWFGKTKRGVIFGIWNSHTSVGNIIGALIASHYVETDWSYSFIVPGVIMSVSGVIVFLFLPEYPADVGCASPRKGNSQNNVNQNNFVRNEGSPILASQGRTTIGFCDALKIPGVVEFSICLFFAKLVSYTFLYWLPGYIKDSISLSDSLSGDLAVVFDIGGIFGGIAAGIISDMSGGKSASVCAVMLTTSIPMLFIYLLFGATSVPVSIVLLLIVGALINGPYALITTAVSAELGTHESLEGNAKALATVTSIIDGTGSIGAAVGPLIAGFVSAYGWMYVFYVLMGSCFFAVLLLSRLIVNEIKMVLKIPAHPTPSPPPAAV